MLRGEGCIVETRRVTDLKGVFADDAARARCPADRIAYSVQMHRATADGTTGGLFFGVTRIEPGTVGDECFMTRGHFHANADRGEYYWGIEGVGLLVLMTRDRQSSVQRVEPGSLHYIPGHTAHRLINTGEQALAVGACWPSDAGHDYDSIASAGFSVRVYRRNGEISIERVG